MTTIGILPASGSGLTDLRKSGQHERLLDYDLRAYANAYDRVYYFSYFRERLDEFTDDWLLRERVRVTHWTDWRAMRACSVLRVEQFSGVLPALVARALWGVPFVVTYGYDYAAVARAHGSRLKPWLYRALERLALPRAAGIIATTAEMALRLSGNVLLIPNGVDLAMFASPVRRPSWPYRRVLYVGRLQPEKNVGRLIEAAALVRYPAIELVIVGEGSLRPGLEAQAQRLGVRATFVGATPYSHIPSWFAEADVFVLPSLTEGNPKAILEAMASGVPIVASARGGILPLIGNDERGLLFDPEDPNGIAQSLRAMLGAPDLAERLVKRARAFIARYDLRRLLAEEVAFVQSVSRPIGTSRAAASADLHPSPRSPMPAAVPGDTRDAG